MELFGGSHGGDESVGAGCELEVESVTFSEEAAQSPPPEVASSSASAVPLPLRQISPAWASPRGGKNLEEGLRSGASGSGRRQPEPHLLGRIYPVDRPPRSPNSADSFHDHRAHSRPWTVSRASGPPIVSQTDKLTSPLSTPVLASGQPTREHLEARLALAAQRPWPPVQCERPRSGCSDPTFIRPRQSDRSGGGMPSGHDMCTPPPTPSRSSRAGVTRELRVSAARVLAGVGRSAARSAGAFLEVEEEPSTFLCLVCFENQRVEQRLKLEGCHSLSHSCCVQCTATFFKARIEQGRVFELFCPVGAAEGHCRPAPPPSQSLLVPPGGAGGNSSADEVVSWNSAGSLSTPEVGGPFAAWAETANLVVDVDRPAIASTEEVEKVLANDAETLTKYRRFLRTKVDPSLRECPDCQHLFGPDLDVDGEAIAKMVCRSCGCNFCYYHAAAHRGGSCEEYEMRLAAETRGIAETLGTQDCPLCGRQTMKTGGCNHMTCQVCRCDWCWICGSSLTQRGPHGEDAVYWHYSDDNIESGCRQFAEAGRHPDAEAVRLWRRGRRPGSCVRRLAAPARLVSVSLLVFSALVALILWLIAYTSAIAIASALECAAKRAAGACRACVSSSSKGMDSADKDEADQLGNSHMLVKPTLYPSVAIGTILFLVPFVVFSLAWAVVSLVAWLVLWPLSRAPVVRRCMPPVTRHHLRFLASSPLRSVHQFGSAVFAQLADAAEIHEGQGAGAV